MTTTFGSVVNRYLCSYNRLDDHCGSLGPFARFGRLGVMDLDEPVNLITVFLDAGKYASMNGPALPLGEPTFHGVEPRGAGRREVKLRCRVGPS
jgi:hypothetical protein